MKRLYDFGSPMRPARPLACPAYLLLSMRELYDLLRMQSTLALELVRGCRLELPHANH